MKHLPQARIARPPLGPRIAPRDASLQAPGGLRRGARGGIAVEFALLLFSIILLFAFVAEFLRFSLINQVLARTTHLSARSVVALPTASGCEAAVRSTFADDATASWLLDRNNDGTLDVVVATADGWPSDAGEVNLTISWDDDPANGVDWSDAAAGTCGGTGSWLRIRARVSALPWYGPFRALAPGGLTLTHESWGRNSRA